MILRVPQIENWCDVILQRFILHVVANLHTFKFEVSYVNCLALWRPMYDNASYIAYILLFVKTNLTLNIT